MMEYYLVYVTVGTEQEAETIGRSILLEKLAACVNISGKTRSLFVWNGKLESSNENLMFIKTNSKKLKLLLKRIEVLHSYDCPSIVALELSDGKQEFFNWIDEVLDD